MKQAEPTNNSTEQRRKLLKGMLSASSVVGLGYSASASAITSLTQCIQNQTQSETTQFAFGATPPIGSKAAWKGVTVYSYTGTGFDKATSGFLLPNNNTVYMAAYPWTVIPLPQRDTSVAGQQAWVVVYFDSSTGSEVGAFPQNTGPTKVGGVVRAQASLNCLNSLKPGLASNYRFGG